MRLKRPVSFLTSDSNVTQTSLFSQKLGTYKGISYFSQIEDEKRQPRNLHGTNLIVLSTEIDFPSTLELDSLNVKFEV